MAKGRKAKADAELDKIEETQAALRDSIEQSKKLAEQSQNLLDEHRKHRDEGDA